MAIERLLILNDEDIGERREIRIQIGCPHWTEQGLDAACSVAIEGYLGRLADIHGIDPLDALELAIKFVDSLLKSLPKTQKIYWSNGEDYFD